MRVMELQEGDRVVTLARVPHEDEEVDEVEIEDDGTAEEGADTPDEPEEVTAETGEDETEE